MLKSEIVEGFSREKEGELVEVGLEKKALVVPCGQVCCFSLMERDIRNHI